MHNEPNVLGLRNMKSGLAHAVGQYGPGQSLGWHSTKIDSGYTLPFESVCWTDKDKDIVVQLNFSGGFVALQIIPTKPSFAARPTIEGLKL